MLRFLIADDHAILRRGVIDIVRREFSDAACSEAENADQVLADVEGHGWDLVILDVSMPGRSGIDVLVDVKRLHPKLPVLILSMHPEDQYGKRVLRAGASGYLNKDSAPEELILAIRKVLAGGRYVSPALAEVLALDLGRASDQPLHDNLSTRELEVLLLIGSGKTNSQIAEVLHLSTTTVSTYRARILEKMDMANSAELMSYVLRNQLVE
jgi:two-component system, NarL family, invasion response regulator UvrY